MIVFILLEARDVEDIEIQEVDKVIIYVVINEYSFMVRSYQTCPFRVIQYAPYRITFCLYFGMEIDLVSIPILCFLIEYLFIGI